MHRVANKISRFLYCVNSSKVVGPIKSILAMNGMQNVAFETEYMIAKSEKHTQLQKIVLECPYVKVGREAANEFAFPADLNCCSRGRDSAGGIA